MNSYFFIAFTLAAAVYSQVVMKWQVGLISVDKLSVFELIVKLLNWWVLSAGLAVLASGISWVYVLSKFQLSYAYNFTSLLFPIMMVAGIVIFKEPFKVNLLIGSLFILIGMVVITR
jgi:drug/metabolite transporter (DMT)-like permease